MAFARAPGLALVLLLTIALGVGSNAAIYGFLQGIIDPLLPVRSGERLVSVFGKDRSRNAGPLSPEEFAQIEKSFAVFAWVGAVRVKPRTAIVDGHAKILSVAAVTPQLGEALFLPLSKGAVISRDLWQREFAGSVSAVGSRVRIDGVDVAIGGAGPERLDGLYSDQSVDVWIAAKPEDLKGAGRERRDLWVVGSLRESASADQAEAEIRAGSAGLREVTVVPFTGMSPSMAHALSQVGLFLSFSAGAVFLVACINVASLLLGRALRRSHETSLRVALGASRGELLRDLLADSVVIAVGGGVLGLLIGILTARALRAFLFEGDAARLTFAPHLLPICAASLLCIVVTVICGMLPVVGTVTDRPWMVLQRETGSPSRGILRLRSSLVVGQIAVCCMLVVCTAVLLTGLHAALETGAGHRLGNPVLLTVQAQPIGGPEIDPSYFDAVEQKVSAIAGLRPLGWTERLPGNEPTWESFRIQQASSQYREVAMDTSWITPESLQALERLPVAGRMFGIGDRMGRVAVVNEAAASELFGVKTAGMTIRDSSDHPLEIIGVVRQKSDKVTSGPGKEADQTRGERPAIYYGYVNGVEAPSTVRGARFRVPVAEPMANVELNANVVSGNYFSVLQMQVLEGRKFSAERITGEGRAAVINQEAADLYFNGKALGSAVIDDSGVRTEIVGVVKSQAFGTFEQHAEPTIFFPIWQDPSARMTLMLKAANWNKGAAAELRQKVGLVTGGSPAPSGVTTFDAQLARSGLAGLRIATLIGGASAAMALLLGLIGTLNVQSDAERQRQRDRALRIALGAQRWRIVLLVMKTAGGLALLGTGIGVLLSLAVVRFVIAEAAIVASPSMQVWLIAPLLPVFAVVMMSILPAGRASLIAPAVIMRDL
jgi:hypothetical protein